MLPRPWDLTLKILEMARAFHDTRCCWQIIYGTDPVRFLWAAGDSWRGSAEVLLLDWVSVTISRDLKTGWWSSTAAVRGWHPLIGGWGIRNCFFGGFSAWPAMWSAVHYQVIKLDSFDSLLPSSSWQWAFFEAERCHRPGKFSWGTCQWRCGWLGTWSFCGAQWLVMSHMSQGLPDFSWD